MQPFPFTPPREQDVHVWQWHLDASDFDLHWERLSEKERGRADKFRFARHRHRFVAARGELRRILGAYLGVPPHRIEFGYGMEGKPYCLTQPPGWRICFNLSHSENAAALAIANGFEVGIDIEQVRPVEASVTREVFSPDERAQFDALPDHERQRVFFESWVRKEACLKALGTGFARPPTHFEFDLTIPGDTAPRFVGGDAEEARHWRIRALSAGPSRAGSVAARCLDWSVVEVA